jgi:hypothetical protein
MKSQRTIFLFKTSMVLSVLIHFSTSIVLSATLLAHESQKTASNVINIRCKLGDIELDEQACRGCMMFLGFGY